MPWFSAPFNHLVGRVIEKEFVWPRLVRTVLFFARETMRLLHANLGLIIKPAGKVVGSLFGRIYQLAEYAYMLLVVLGLAAFLLAGSSTGSLSASAAGGVTAMGSRSLRALASPLCDGRAR